MRTLTAPLLLMISFAGDAKTQAPQPYHISVNVDLVVLHATVHDRKGGFASGLREQDFALYEAGVRQSIRLFRHEDIPVTVGLVVDHSGSMRSKLADVIAAARSFMLSSSPSDEMFVVNFNENVTRGLPPRIRFTNRPDELARAISNTRPTGQTALYDAIDESLELLQSGAQEKKVLIVISDGGDNSSAHTLAESLKKAERSNALIYTIGIFDEDDPDRNPEVLRRFARVTGGEALFPGRVSEIVATCERIARDIRNQYTLGYVSSRSPQAGSYNPIQVVARNQGHRKLVVRTRSGYSAGGESTPVHAEAAKGGSSSREPR